MVGFTGFFGREGALKCMSLGRVFIMATTKNNESKSPRHYFSYSFENISE
jgi:nicotinamide mononucleotide (NMN) deamidase PncC